MFKKLCVSLVGLAILSANAQNVNLQGVVSNSSGKPIANAIVSLTQLKLKDTTGTDGKFSFVTTSVKQLSPILPKANDISLKNDILQFDLNTPSPLKIEIFNLKGNLLKQEIVMNAAAGTYQFDISKNYRAENVLMIRAALGNSEITFKYIPLNGAHYVLSRSNTPSYGLAKKAADVDTLTVTANGYQTKSIALSSLVNPQLNVTLDTIDPKNIVGPSAGCGKNLGSVNKSGTYYITSNGKNRKYIIDIPTNYDKNKPYRLIFGMHCLGGSAEKVAGLVNDQTAHFYGLKPLANKDNIQCIYIAMQGNDGGTWNADTDSKFFSDLLGFLKDNFCIDTTRVFSVGFSFGAMFTYSLSLQFQKQLRAVACIAPANYNIWLPTDKKLPIGYMQVTGTQDGTCPWVNNDAQKRGGKYCLLNHLESNGCTNTSNIPIANSGKHVTTEFQCKEGYPVKFCSFVGGHVCNAKDQGSNVDWIPVETWDFFKKF